ncbi:hypothetical protein [Spirosoma fluminis]
MLYPVLVALHSALRWFVLGGLVVTLFSAYSGWITARAYRPADQTLRIVTTSILHTQLLVGFYLYTISPIIKHYWSYKPSFSESPEFPFFGLIHISFMFTSVILMTVGSSKAKRQTDPQRKFKTTAVYFTIGLLLILIAIPWPFSPLAARPFVRPF